MTSRLPASPVASRRRIAAPRLAVAGLIVALGLLIPVPAVAAPAGETGFVRHTFRDETGEHGYVVHVPRGYTPDRAWPVMLFLHGAGERGTDGVRQSEIGLGAMIRRWGDFPWIVVFPQAEDKRRPIETVWSAEAPDGRRALAILDEVERTYRIDPNHRVLTGWSMGGRGSYMLAAAFPRKWSAVMPIAGWADPELADRLVDVPLWSFHGTADTLVSYDEDKLLIDRVVEQGGAPFFTTLPDRGHYIWRTVYASPVVFEWLSDPARFADRSAPPELDPLPEVVLPKTETHGPFVPALELHRAVATRLGPDLFTDLSAAATAELAARPLTGVVPGTTTQSREAGILFTVSTSPMYYRVPVTDVEVVPTSRGTLAVRATISHATLTIPQTRVRGWLCSATAGPMCVRLAHRRPLTIGIEATPYICNGQFRLKTRSVQFALPPGNWSVTPPPVRRESLLLSPDRVSQSLVDGIYTNEWRIEQQIRRTIAESIDSRAFELPPVSNDQLLTVLWPVPAYRPRIKPRLEDVSVDENGLAVVFGLSVAAVDPFDPPAPKTIDFGLTFADVGHADVAIAATESLIRPLTAQLIEAGVAHVNVIDIPDGRYAQFADREVLTELIPAIAALPPETEFRTEFVLREPLDLDDSTLTDKPDGRFSVFDLRVPNLTAVISVRKPQGDWQEYAEFAYDVTQPVRLQLGRPVESGRQVISACNDSPEIHAAGQWLVEPPADPRFNIEAAINLFHQSWTVWSDACKPTAIVIPDLEFRGYVRRLTTLEPAPYGMSVGFEEPETIITNESELPLVFSLRLDHQPTGPSPAQELLTLAPGEQHVVRSSRPVGYESSTGGHPERYTIPPGRTAIFKPLDDGRLGLILESFPQALDAPLRVPGTF